MVFILASSVARLTWLLGCVISRLLLTQVNDNNRQLQATNNNQVRMSPQAMAAAAAAQA